MSTIAKRFNKSSTLYITLARFWRVLRRVVIGRWSAAKQRLRHLWINAEIDDYRCISKTGSDSANPWIRKSSRIDGWLFPGEPMLLWEAASIPGDGDILEIGTWQGKSTCILAGACIEGSSNSKVICVDTFLMDGNDWQLSYHKRLVKEQGTYFKFVHNAKMFGFFDTIVVMAGYSYRVVPYINARIKVAFIDGSHDFENTLRDLRLTMPLIRPGGLILLHDVNDNWPGVGLAIEASLRRDPCFQFVKKVGSIECWENVARSF
jgi:predicted O-methyltransferase YrrM